MNRTVLVVLITVGLVAVGAAFLKGFNDSGTSNPIASVQNGAPRGLLALKLLLASEGKSVAVVERFDDPLPAPGNAWVLVPPPETSGWSDAEATALIERVQAGDHALVLCDDDGARTERLHALLEAAGVECERADVPIGDDRLTKAAGVMPGFAHALYVRGAGRVHPKPHMPAFPAWIAGTDAVVVERAFGKGVLSVMGTATVLANDGIAKSENAAFLLDQVGARTVLVDERHHGSRSKAAVLEAAARGVGPLTALLALLLLVPLSLLSLAPRPGDPPRDDDVRDGAPAAEAQARALAALLVRRG